MPSRICTLTLSLLLLCGTLALSASAVDTPSIAPSEILTLRDGSLIMTDVYNKALWLQEPGSTPVRIAGRQGVNDAQGVPTGGYVDGKAELAAFCMPWSLTPYLDGYAVSDTENHVLRYVADGNVITLAGSGKPGFATGTSTKASFNRPTGLITLADGSLLLTDTENHVIRQISTEGKVTVYAGSIEGCTDGSLSSAKLREPTALCYVNGILYVADSGNNRICKVEAGKLTTLAGALDGTADFINGKTQNARFSSPQGLVCDGSTLYVADTGNGAVRMIRDGKVTTLVQNGQAGYTLYPVQPRGLAISGDTLYVGDIFTKTLFTVSLSKQESYSDVSKRDWFHDTVQTVSTLGLLNGTGEGKFSPNATVTRAMTVTVLARLEQAIRPNTVIGGADSFLDIPVGAYYAAPASWAKSKSIASGDGQNFIPNVSVTRADLATFLYRYATASGLDNSQRADLTPFVDKDAIPFYASDAFAWVCAVGVISGKESKQLDPTGSLTRSELAAMAARFFTLI